MKWRRSAWWGGIATAERQLSGPATNSCIKASRPRELAVKKAATGQNRAGRMNVRTVVARVEMPRAREMESYGTEKV